MYNAQITKEKIKSLCKSKKINMEQMLIECNLGVNAIRQINGNKGMASFSLAKIADYLDCSVDYLLGRTSNSQTISQSNVVNGNNGDYSPLTIHNDEKLDEMSAELLKMFKNLSFKDKMEVMNFMMGKFKE